VTRIDRLSESHFDVWLLSYLAKQPLAVFFAQESKLMGHLDNRPIDCHTAEFGPHSSRSQTTPSCIQIATKAILLRIC
jgi:hypothetical protein